MSKEIKQLEMNDLKNTFQDVRDLVVLSVTKQDCHADHGLRTSLAKKNIRLKMVKNSLARRVFGDLGINVDKLWDGPTVVAWGSSSMADLSKELDALIKKNDKLKVKGAVAEGLEITFQQALKMPTRAEALGRLVSLVLSPASRLMSQIMAPASNIAAQIKTLTEAKAPEGETAPAPA
jgi:large subunit ribosomal protein L10